MRVWPQNFKQFFHFGMAMTDAELKAVWFGILLNQLLHLLLVLAQTICSSASVMAIQKGQNCWKWCSHTRTSPIALEAFRSAFEA